MQQTRLRALGKMASGIAHDFNNSLTILQGFSELMIMYPDSLDDRAKTLERLKKMRSAARDAADTVRRMRKFYRQPDINEIRTTVKLGKLIEEVISMTEPQWREQALAAGGTIGIENEVTGEPTVTGNAVELQEVLLNLVLNALDALQDEGKVTIGCRMEGNEAVIDVIDTGCGMSEETRRHCFDPFFSTKEAEGSGLGLSVAYGIIERHNGKIKIQSTPGTGTRCTVRLPAESREPNAKTDKAAGPVSSSLSILVVEDDPNVSALVISYLSEAGHKAESASNGMDGLRRFGKGWFDLVITDLAMPDMGGDQFASSVKQVASDKPVIMITGFDDKVETVNRSHVDLVLPKPLSQKQLLDGIAQLVEAKA